MQLRDYQKTCLQEAIEAWQRDPNKNYIIDACVSAGKSHMLAAFIKGLIDANPGFTCLMLVPNKELVKQNYDKLVGYLGEELVGICSASAGDKATDKPIIVGTVGTVIGRIYDMPVFHTTHVDEVHLVNNADKGQYRALLDICKKRNPEHITFGWTGTPYRGNGINLTSGKAPLFHEIASSITLRDMLDAGWICPLVNVNSTHIEVSSKGMRKTGQDFNLADIDAAFDDEVTQQCVEQMIPAMQDRRSVMVFCSTIPHAERTAEMLKKAGQKVGIVHSKMTGDRDRVIKDFKQFRTKWLVNVCVLTTGFDHPAVDGIVFMRNTSSPVLYVQIAGRGMRRYDDGIGNLFPGHTNKIDCKWLDFTDTTSRLGPVDQVKGRDMIPKNRKAVQPVKSCPMCGLEVASGVRTCECGHTFQFENKLGSEANGSAVLSTDVDMVTGFSVLKHVSQKGNIGVKVVFKNGSKTVGTFYMNDSAWGTRQIRELWGKLGGTDKAPINCSEFMARQHELVVPAAITLDRSKQFPELKEVHHPVQEADA